MPTRVVQRTPNLGLKIRMVKDVAPVVQADCCEPEIGPARWYNLATGAYDLETVVAYSHITFDYFTLSTVAGERQMLYTAHVTGDLCDCAVSWGTGYSTGGGGEIPFISIQMPGRGLAVGLDKGEYQQISPGVLTATATVTCRDGTTKTLPPIYLVVLAETYGCCG